MKSSLIYFILIQLIRHVILIGNRYKNMTETFGVLFSYCLWNPRRAQLILAAFCVQQPHVFSGHHTVQPGLYTPDLIPLLLFSLEPTRVRVLPTPCTQFVLAKVIIGFHDHFMFSSQLMAHQRHLVESITLFLNCFLEFLSCSFFAFSFSVSFAPHLSSSLCIWGALG